MKKPLETGSWNLVLAVVYFLTGHLGLLLATPPGFATAVWPASGIALGWVLIGGARLLPGVILGSFAVNLTISIRASGVGLFEVGWTIPLLIALGAAMQAALGAWLIRRWAGFPSELDDPRTILRTLVLGGLVATTLNASWSVTLLYLNGIIPAGRWLHNWVTWWVGDSIGVLVFTPLVLVWGMRAPFFHRGRAIMVTIVLTAAFSAAVFGFLLVAKLESTDRISRFRATSAVAITQFTRCFAEYESFAIQLRGLFDSQDHVSREAFAVFVSDWQRKHPEVRAVQWAPRITRSARPEVESQLAAFTGQSVPLRDLGASIAAGDREEYVPLLYTEPVEPTRFVLGMDLLSEPNRRATLQAAAEAGEPLITPPVTLIQDRQAHPSVLLYTPVYAGREHQGQHWDRTRGFVVLVLRMDEVLAGLTRDTLPPDLRLVLVDQPTRTLLAGQRPETRTTNLARLMHLTYEERSRFGGRPWQLEVWPTAAYLEHYDTWLTWIVLVGGLLGTSLAVSFTLITSGRRQYLERTVASRTRELTERNDELETARRRAVEATRDREEARLEAVQANQAKGQFLASMSHEIRTPMNAILGFTQLLLRNGFKGKDQEYLTHIDTASRALLGLINDILDFSKIEAGKMELHEVAFRLDEVLRGAIQQVMLPATGKGLEMVLDIAPDVPLELKGDSLRLGQILLNLCTNAVKFTEQGDIVLGVDMVEARSGEQVTLHFWVRDSGIGIALEDRPRLFGLFNQVDSGVTRKYGGTGLGLAICARLVRLMGGEIGVESTPGQGSLFHFTLPFGLMPAARGPVNEHALPGRLRVLVVDDSATARAILGNQLRQLACTVVCASSGEEALRLIVEAAWEEPFDCVLLDWIMPGWDGLETVRRLRSEPTLARVPPLLLMTGHLHALPAQALKEAAFAACLEKPVTAILLREAILRAYGGQRSERLMTDRPLPRFAPARILLVEDNHANRVLATDMLRRLGLQVDVAGQGEEGLRMLNEATVPYALVLMDLQMPVMDGFEAATRMRARYSASELPIVAVTAYAMPVDRQRCLAIGMNAHLAKPVDVQVLAAMLARFLPLAASTVSEPDPAPPVIQLAARDAAPMADALRELDRQLRRHSFDARRTYEAYHAALAALCPEEAGELLTRMMMMDYRGAREALMAIAAKLGVALD